jgi:hypothetical protein
LPLFGAPASSIAIFAETGISLLSCRSINA